LPAAHLPRLNRPSLGTRPSNATTRNGPTSARLLVRAVAQGGASEGTTGSETPPRPSLEQLAALRAGLRTEATEAIARSRAATTATQQARSASGDTRGFFWLDAHHDVHSRDVPALTAANLTAIQTHDIAVGEHDASVTAMTALGERLMAVARDHMDEGSPASVDHSLRLQVAGQFARLAASHHLAARGHHATSRETHREAASGHLGSTPVAVDAASRASEAAAIASECVNAVCDALHASGIVDHP
jgi:hypothetical protein